MPCTLPDSDLVALLRDDVPHGDLTTTALGLGAVPAALACRARQPLTLAASEEAARLFELAGAKVTRVLPTGHRADAGALLLAVQGPAGALHHAWKVAQTLMEYASGVASAASAMVNVLRAAGLSTPVACTRKHFPGTKAVAVKAVLAGGAVMHRLGLSETLLVFPEHRALMPESEWATRLVQVRAQNPEKKLVAEVGSVDDAVRLARCGADVIQLEKFSPDQVARCRAALAAEGLQVCLAAAGGIHAANALAYVRAGADVLVTSAPYAAPPVDVKVTLGPLGTGESP